MVRQWWLCYGYAIMLFDIGCCCTVPSGGIYDFWRAGGTYSQVADQKDNEHIISRSPSQHRIISGYLDDVKTYGGDYNGTQVTSYCIGEYMDLFTTTGTQYPSEETILWDGTASIKNVGAERLWYQGQVPRTGGYDFFNHSGLGYSSGTGTTIGNGARIEGDYLILTTGALTSGCFVRWTFPQTYAQFLEFNIPRTFDKTILCRISGTGTATEHWYKPSVITSTTFSNYAVIKQYETGTPVFTGADFALQENQFYHPNESDLSINLRYSIEAGDIDDLTMVELRLVDNTGSYSIDDISGYALRIRNLIMPTYTGLTPVMDDIYLYTDPVNKSILASSIVKSSDYFILTITGNDVYRYSRGTSSGLADTDRFSVENFNRSVRTQDSDMGIATDSSFNFVNPLLTGSIVVDRLLNSNGLTQAKYGTQYARNVFINQYTASTQVTFPEIRHWCYSPVSTYQGTTNTLRREPITYNYIEATGNKTRWYGFNHIHDLVEYDVPQSEKQLFYEKLLNPSGQTYNPTSLSLWNTSTNLPRICFLDYDSKPNAFSVKLPKQDFIQGTGSTSITTFNVGSRTGSLSQTIQILYGPIKQEVFTITALSGIGFSGTNVPSDTDMTGVDGTRPSSNFSYNSGSVRTGRAYGFDFDLLYGDNTGQVIWSDTFQQTVPYTPTFYTNVTNPYTGLLNSPTTLNCTAMVLWGGKHLPTNKIGCSFVHSRNHIISTGSNAGGASGEAYIKVSIDGNIVHNQRIYGDDVSLNDYPPVKGPYVLHSTEEDLRNNMTGNYAAFVWFELLYKRQPVPTTNISASGAGEMTGYKMHVCGSTGNDLWTVSHSGLLSFFNNGGPYVIDSSDRFFYVENFNMPHTGNVTYGSIATTFPRTETISGTQYRYYGGTSWISGMLQAWGFAHDRSALIPGGWETDFEVTLGSVTKKVHPNQSVYHDMEGNCIKNSALFVEAPTTSLFATTFPYTGMYYTYTGIDPFFPSGYNSCELEGYQHPHFLYFTNPTGISGYKIVDSGNYLTFDQDYLGISDHPDLCDGIWYYVASGTGTTWL